METSTLATLKDLGLKEPEADAYLTLLKMGGATASALAKEMGIKRTTAYPLLKALGQKGFITTYYRNSKQFFLRKNPAVWPPILSANWSISTLLFPLLPH